ncbi:hypothetical protein EOD23_27545 [Mesorhizobium sp. USDA-HM6]|nr:hypothetical protein EOD23_27545 [Mesorhizobium sp. USDA-HM6]
MFQLGAGASSRLASYVPDWRLMAEVRYSGQHPSTVSALRADPPSPTRGEGRGLSAPPVHQIPHDVVLA